MKAHGKLAGSAGLAPAARDDHRCIFLTAHAEFRYAQEALRLGGFDYIMQPAPYEQVADAVSRALENVKEERAALELQSRVLFLTTRKGDRGDYAARLPVRQLPR